ncbi:gliding motility-associated C-terminal domain-containing protein [Pedobacter sp. SYSU D00535]|uniref:gliding motility-associated C-terminal domain-containing protein n=1 Tax=Pedobacter sp. SYSU D00535 TaxID=2810308 RepID=UPI001A979FB8|nr:gliding motility-associated C-terminal domain-containing protein [Pedobacter sp. SYSU D00535]
MKKNALIWILGAVFSMEASAQVVNTGQTISVDAGGLFFVDTDYIHEGGQIKNAGLFDLKGDWKNNSLTSVIFAPGSSGEVLLSGNQQQLGGKTKTSFVNLRLAGNGDKTLGVDAEVGGELYLEDKQLHASRFSLTISNPAIDAIKRTTGFITTDEKGYLIRKTNQGASYLFPLGSLKNNPNFLSYNPLYRPISFEPENTQENSFSASLNNIDPSLEGFDRNRKRYDIESVSDRYFYLISHNFGSSKFNVRFYQNKDLESNTPQVINWGSYSMWEKLPSSVEDGNFDVGLNRSLVYTSAQLINQMPITFASTTDLSNPFTFFNAFSPDGDGRNDTWTIGNIDYFPQNDLTIFNRWGDEVFRTSGYSNAGAWDGGNMQAGTYFYVLNVKINGDTKTYKGFITMIKKD